MNKGKFIVVESINSSIRKHVASSICKENPKNYLFIKKREIVCNDVAIAEIQKKLAELMWPHNDNEIGKELPFQYWLHLQVCWYSLRTKFDVNPILSENISVIVDSWYYSFLAKSLIGGMNKDYLIETFKHISMADQVILILVTDFEQLWKDNVVEIKPSKFGVHQGYVDESKETFLKYHMDLQNQLLKIADEYHWLIIPQNELKSKHFNL